MAATLFYLVRNVSSLSKATMEVRSRFTDVEAIHQGAELVRCTYLRACIDEAMRLSPSVGGLLPREVLPGGTIIDGVTIPAGTVVGTPHYVIHHNTENYPQPFKYIPERWIVGASWGAGTKVDVTEADVGAAQSAFCPFSIGPRGCIGKGLAYVEMMTTLARLLFLYDVRKAEGVHDPGEGGGPGAQWGRHRQDEFQLVDTFTSLKDGPMIQFRRRE
jgi:cytochrome P450